MRAVITGGTGFIGRHLLEALPGAVALSRDPERAQRSLGAEARVVRWRPESEPPPARAFDGVDVVFHLAGEPIANGRWNAEKKRRIRDSRVLGTRALVAGLESLPSRPRILVSASAVGYYGDRGDQLLGENAGSGHDFLAKVCAEWESEALRAAAFGVRVVIVRTGIVLGEGGGVLSRMLPPFRLGLGGPFGNGRQWMSWVHMDDLMEIFLHAARTETIHGPLNAVAPTPVRNKTFASALGRTLKRPAMLAVPPLVLRVALGELSETLLASQRVVPRVALQTGYSFRFRDLEEALRATVGKHTVSSAAVPLTSGAIQ
jgi:uncharacterized protein (TIGR01777 family)